MPLQRKGSQHPGDAAGRLEKGIVQPQDKSCQGPPGQEEAESCHGHQLRDTPDFRPGPPDCVRALPCHSRPLRLCH